MEEKNLNANETEEVVQPQSGAEEIEESAAPQTVDVDDMTDDEFEDYLSKLAQDEKISAPEVKPSEASDEEQSAAESGGSEDNSDEKGTAKPAGADDKTQPFKTFQSQEEYQSEIDRIVSKRYGELRQKNRGELEMLDRLKTQARNFYTDAADDDAAVAELIADLQQQNADRQGIGIEEYKQNMQQAEDAKRFRDQQSLEAQQQARITEIQNRWRAESESLKKIVPTFDFQKALENKTFYDAISAGESVHMAYMMANKQAEAQKPQPPARKPIAQVAQQKGGMAGKTHVNVDNMTDEEFDEYISRQMDEE